MQHLTDEAQTRWRVIAAREALRRISGVAFDAPEEVIVGSAWGYRIRTQLHLAEGAGAAQVGYYGRGSHQLVPVEVCPVLAEPLEKFVLGLSKRVGTRVPRRLDVALGDEGSLTCGPVLPELPRGEVFRRVGEFEYGFDARTFFQGHEELLPRLVDVVVGSQIGGTAYDLYAGVGLFSLPLAGQYEQVVAVESDSIAVRYARKNAQRNRMENITVEASAVDSWIGQLPNRAERVVIDPPRVGLGRRLRAVLSERRPEHISYVSCHPAALARDLAALAASHTLERIVYLDLFPQTGHIEIVAQLRARPSGG